MSYTKPFFTYEHYRHILQSALNNGYEFTSFSQYAKLRNSGRKILLLRHDLDLDLKAARDMAHIEHSLGVRSTYFFFLRSPMYNLLSRPHIELAKEILSLGHWAGLHFTETAELGDIDGLMRQIERERSLLTAELNTSIDVLSFHQPSEAIINNEVKIGLLNTYDREDFKGTFYLSDSNCGFRHGCPSLTFNNPEHPQVQLLIHPEWWTEQAQCLETKWHTMYKNNFRLVQDFLLTTENAYNVAKRVELTDEPN